MYSKVCSCGNEIIPAKRTKNRWESLKLWGFFFLEKLSLIFINFYIRICIKRKPSKLFLIHNFSMSNSLNVQSNYSRESKSINKFVPAFSVRGRTLTMTRMWGTPNAREGTPKGQSLPYPSAQFLRTRATVSRWKNLIRWTHPSQFELLSYWLQGTRKDH